MKPAQTSRTDSLSPWISPAIGRVSKGASSSTIDSACVLLVDDREAFRFAVAAELQRHGVQVLTATGAYDAWHLAHRRSIDLIVIRGDLHSQSGWQCAAKLCGRPPWNGVVMHFDRLRSGDRNWKFAAGLAGLIETGGQAENVVHCVLRAVGTLPSATDNTPARPLSVAGRV